MLKLLKLCLTLLSLVIFFTHGCEAVNSASSGSVNSPFQPPQPLQQPQAPDNFGTTLGKLREQYDGAFDLVRIDPAHYARQSPHWFNFLAKAGGKHVVVRGNDGRLYAMDRTPLGDSANILRSVSPVPGSNLYRIWKVKNFQEGAGREFQHLAYMNNERDFRWRHFAEDRLFSYYDLTDAIAHF